MLNQKFCMAEEMLLIASIFLCSSYLSIAQDTAEITDSNGNKILVTDLKFVTNEEFAGTIMYLGVAKETEISSDSVPMFTGDYIVRVPLSMIQRVTKINVNRKTKDEDLIYCSDPLRIPLFTVTLTNSFVVKGQLCAQLSSHVNNQFLFVGKSELGNFKIDANGPAEIILGHKAAPSYKPSAAGEKYVIVTLPNGKEMEISGAAFVEELFNKNGCYTGDKYSHSLMLRECTSQNEVEWENISELRFTKSESERGALRPMYEDAQVSLISKSGREWSGKTNVDGVEGLANVLGLRLRVVVPLFSRCPKIVFNK